MANLNKVMLIGRLTRKPEKIEIRGEVQGAKFGFAVNNRKYNEQKKEWEEIPVFIDMEIWNRGESRQADRVLSTLDKGHQVFIEGHLRYETWDDKTDGKKRSKLSVVVDSFQYLEKRSDVGGGGSSGEEGEEAPPPRASRPAATPPRQSAATSARASSSSRPAYSNEDEDFSDPPPSRGGSRGGGSGGSEDDDIPF